MSIQQNSPELLRKPGRGGKITLYLKDFSNSMNQKIMEFMGRTVQCLFVLQLPTILQEEIPGALSWMQMEDLSGSISTGTGMVP